MMPIRNSETSWEYPRLQQIPGVFQAGIGGSPLVAKTLYQRGLTGLDEALAFLNPDLYSPASPDQLPGLIEAADLLEAAIGNDQQILIWGDFDVDGQTSTTLLYSGLSQLGAQVDFYIPNRARESHGIFLPTLQQKIDQVQPDLLLTCDTGIDEAESIQFARDQGVEVIITDHHKLPETLPQAGAIINPNLVDPDHPLYSLPGVGVAYKLVEELFSRQGQDPTYLLDLAALGIVADVAVQTRDTRYLLQRGLEVLRMSPRLGLEELYKLAGISANDITEEDIGFAIGPRLNALGRLDDANPIVEFLTTDDKPRAHQLAVYLDTVNSRRQELTEQIYQGSLEKIENDPSLVELFPVIVLAGPPSWDPGVIGIVASRLVERFHKPVIMLSEDGPNYRGSARSIPGVDITQLIASSSDLLNSFGGHPMAAGLTLPSVNVSHLRTSLADDFARTIGELPAQAPVRIDSELAFQDVSPELIEDFNRLAPFGPGNPKLQFATRGAALLSPDADRLIGRNKNHRKLTLVDPNGDTLDFLWWNSAENDLPAPPFDVAYSLDLTTFKNQVQTQVTLRHVRKSPLTPVYLKQETLPTLHDFRQSKDPLSSLREILADRNVQVWSEFSYPERVKSFRRDELQPDPLLAIWTIPPSRLVLAEIIEQVRPQEIYLFSTNPSFTSVSSFVRALLGLLKHLEASQKRYHPGKFAQALAVPIDCVELGLEWIGLHGDYDVSTLLSDAVILAGPGYTLPGFLDVDSTLKRMLQEIIAYREYYLSAPIEALL